MPTVLCAANVMRTRNDSQSPLAQPTSPTYGCAGKTSLQNIQINFDILILLL